MIPLHSAHIFCLSEYNETTGSTKCFPGSQNIKNIDLLEKSPTSINAKKGDIIVFNSMLIHGAGINNSLESRIGINQMFSKAFIKQQINIPNCISKTGILEKDRILGFETPEYNSVAHFRNSKLEKLKKG